MRLSRLAVLSAMVLGMLLYSSAATAGHMFLEYRGELAEGYTFFRGAFDLADINHDGADEMVIADDEGGFHVYRFTRAGFEQIWVSAPLLSDGHIVAVEVIHEDLPGIMPKILLLDSNGTLHQVRYTGYLFEETATYEDYRAPGESGRLVLTDIGGGGRAVLIALPNSAEGAASGASGPSPGSETESIHQWTGWTLYRLKGSGIEQLTEEEMARLEEGDVYFVQELTEVDITKLQSIGESAGRLFPARNDPSGRAGIADLDKDALYELLVAASDPDRPIDRLQIYSGEGGDFRVRFTLELPLINEMVLGDVDGDGVMEIVGLTYDGEVLIYQYDPLTVRVADGTELEWEVPHKDLNGTIWMSLGGFEALGCSAVEHPDVLELSYDDRLVVLNRTERTIKCGEATLIPVVPDEAVETAPFLPFFSTLDCLGFLYTYDPELDLVEVERAE